ncbi:MAG TPA: hypothetical protein VFX98_12160 [Longimicrobiaceae bacterium]|nr:hypothetical protein [Longimicrobiaceae bacterium]
MARVHLRGVRYRVREAAVLGVIQQYTGESTVELRRLVEQLQEGAPVALQVEDLDAAYELAAELDGLGVNAEPDESEY